MSARHGTIQKRLTDTVDKIVNHLWPAIWRVPVSQRLFRHCLREVGHRVGGVVDCEGVFYYEQCNSSLESSLCSSHPNSGICSIPPLTLGISAGKSPVPLTSFDASERQHSDTREQDDDEQGLENKMTSVEVPLGAKVQVTAGIGFVRWTGSNPKFSAGKWVGVELYVGTRE